MIKSNSKNSYRMFERQRSTYSFSFQTPDNFSQTPTSNLPN